MSGVAHGRDVRTRLRLAGVRVEFVEQDDLTPEEFVELVRTVFRPVPGRDRRLAVLLDVPRDRARDSAAWRDRRVLAADWTRTLGGVKADLGLESADLLLYPDVGSNNADLPSSLRRVPETAVRAMTGGVDAIPIDAETVPTEAALAAAEIVLAPTEYSTTAPLKILSKRLRFRAATLPGFTRAMVPALRLDTAAVSRRVNVLKERLDAADSAKLELDAGGSPHSLVLDLRFRTAHASDGLVREPGTAANLPSGEAYVVPYEGERAGEKSRTSGTLPVQISPRGDLVVLDVEENRVKGVRGDGPDAAAESARFREEPAYGNVAELGLGVLGDFGIRAVGSVLLDEKLGLHVAFGRSDHFGGSVGPKDFRDQSRVVHVDRVYVPETQPLVAVRRVSLRLANGREEDVIRDGRYCV